jgi:cytochrome c-type biogenesis protein CcmH
MRQSQRKRGNTMSDVHTLPDKPSLGLWAGMVLFVLVVTTVGYAWLGQPLGWGLVPGQGTAAAEASADQAVPSTQDVANLLSELQARTEAAPDDAQAWAMLARAYAGTGQHAQAVPAFRRAMALQPRDAQLMADFADALSVTQNYAMAGEPEQLVKQALALDPQHFKALSMMGMVYYEKQAFKEAALAWSQAIALAPVNSGDLLAQMQRARDDAAQRAGLDPATLPKAKAQPQVPANQAQVSGRVSLAPALAAQVSPDDTVFVFARAVQGSRMPLAILRKQVKNLPFDFTLTDAMAMAPEQALSTVQQVVVGARVSRTGQAMPQAGDWQGLSAPVPVGASGLAIEIAQPVQP